MTGGHIVIVGTGGPSTRALTAPLARLGYAVETVLDVDGLVGPDAASEPDLLLVDLASLPEGSRLSQDTLENAETPVLFAVPSHELGSGAHPAHSDPALYLVTPFTDRELHATVELALRSHDAARAVRRAEERFFHNSLDLMCQLGFDGYFERLNPAWERTLGFSLEELTSRPFLEFVHPEDRERTLAQNAQVRSGGQALGFENRYLCKDGSYRWLHWNATPDDGAGLIYSMARDVTEHRHATAERERLVADLQAALAEVRTLRKILPICSYCRKIRDDEDYWDTVEAHISRHTGSRFSHGICPTCMETEVEPLIQALEGEESPSR